MLIETACVGPWMTNCYLLSPDGSSCIVVDAGIDAEPAVLRVLRRHHLTLAGVMATHGHIDHIGDAATLANRAEVPLWLHSADDYMMTTPSAGLGPDSVAVLTEILGADSLPAPTTRGDLAGVDQVEVGGLTFGVHEAPGHTPGSVILTFDDEGQQTALCGDVIFANSVGRTDMPGGDPVAMAATLADLRTWDQHIRLLPGHGPATTVGRERTVNPYLRWEGII